jgi:hypothetical protein
MMRGAFAAACAAVLMGLASPGAFACASLAAARGAAEQQHSAFAPHAASRSLPARVERRTDASPTGLEAASAPPAGERAAAWRAPSGPAPSQGPPAARS